MSQQNQVVSEATRELLKNLRGRLLRLHKALLDIQRAAYEQKHGRIASSGELLQLVINHEEFAWLRALSAFVVRIDELFDVRRPDAEPVTEDEARDFIRQARQLLTPAESGDDFARKYHAALQDHPQIVLDHGEITKLFSGLN